MADAKPKKPAEKKIIDVKHGDGDAASGTSRQIILNNRPIMQDPMMAEVTELANAQVGVKGADTESAEAPGAPVITTRKKVIPVAHNEGKADAPAPVKVEEPKKTAKPAKVDKKPVEEKPVPKDPGPKAVETPTDTEIDAKPAEETPAANDETASSEEAEAKTETSAEPAEPKAEASSSSAEKSDEETPEETKDGGFAGERAAVSNAQQPGRSFDEKDAPAAPSDDSGTEDESDAKDKKAKPQLQPGELTPEQQKAFDKGEYFLPIITTETRRMRLEIVLAALFIIIILAVWLDVMLDAGLLHISGVQPLTHFFNS